jgi:HSP20 family molecular chaperone IbpA
MYGTDWLVEHDLSLTFDNSGRMWKFRPTSGTHGEQPVDAHRTPEAIVITVTVPGMKTGDVDLSAADNVLRIRGKADATMHLAADVALPRPVQLETLGTLYVGEVLEISVPLVAPKRVEAPIESIAVAV